ncbi:MAG: DUF2510 domain-containing protein [Propionibacteriaceae bacterium]|nr:DUF2510 domain-containing protein [Propionibacteriaceae bacterium]
MTQTRLPDWYPDPSDSSIERWWDGMAWTNNTRSLAGEGEVSVQTRTIVADPDQSDSSWRLPSHAGMIAGILFLITAVLAAIQALYMTTVFSMAAMRAPGMGVPIALPFNWYLLLYPYWIWSRAFFSWGLIPPALVLAGCAATAFTLGRHKPRAAIITIAALMTVQNLLLLIPIFLDSGAPGLIVRPIFSPSVFASAGATGTLVGILILYVVIWALPLLFAATCVGSPTTRRRIAMVFVTVFVLYLLWYAGAALFASPASSFLLTPGFASTTPGVPVNLGAGLAPLSTLMCFVGMTLFVLPSLRRVRA